VRVTPLLVRAAGGAFGLHAGFPFLNLLHVEGTDSVLAPPSEMTFWREEGYLADCTVRQVTPLPSGQRFSRNQIFVFASL